MNESLYVCVWKKPFCRHLNNFFNIDNATKQKEENNANYDYLDTMPKRDETMNAFYLRSKQRAVVIEYYRKKSFFQSMFGTEQRRENIFKAMLKTMLNRMINDDDDEMEIEKDKNEMFTFHDCNASIQWIFECEWSVKRESLQKVLFDEFTQELSYKLGHIWTEKEFNDKSMKQLLLMLYWLLKLFANRFKFNWIIEIMHKLVTYIGQKNQTKDVKQSIFEYLNVVFGKRLIWNDVNGQNMMKYIANYTNRKQQTFINEFLPCVLWYNVCYQCAVIEKDGDYQNNINTLQQMHGSDILNLQQRFDQIKGDLVNHSMKLFKTIICINDKCDYNGNSNCIELRDTFLLQCTFNDFLVYLEQLHSVKNIESFSKILGVYNRNITDLIETNDGIHNILKWRNYLKKIYDLLEIDGDELNDAQVQVLNNAIHPIFGVINNINDEIGADELQKLLSELPTTYNQKTVILMKILSKTDNFLLFEHAEKFMDLIVEQILSNEHEMEHQMNVIDDLNQSEIPLTTHRDFGFYKIEMAIRHWMTQKSKVYTIQIMEDHNIPWIAFANTIKSMIENDSKQQNNANKPDKDDLSMRCFETMLSYMTDRDIPIVGRLKMVKHLVSFWRESAKERFNVLNKLFMALFDLLFIGNDDESELYDAITKEFRSKYPYNQSFDHSPSTNDNNDDDDDNKQCELHHYDTIISEKFLCVSAYQCKLTMNQESFYRFGKSLDDPSNPFQRILLKQPLYLMGILMQRLDEDSKCDRYFSECIRLHTKNDDNTLKAFYFADVALRCYYKNKQKQSKEFVQKAVRLSGEGYINLINSLINDQEKSINDVIQYFDSMNCSTFDKEKDDEKEKDKSSNFSYFARFCYCRWLTKHGEYNKAKNEYEIILKRFGNQKDENVVVLNGLLHYEYGILLLDQKKNDSAKEQFHAAMKMKPCLPNIYERCNEELKKLDGGYEEILYLQNEKEEEDDGDAEFGSDEDVLVTKGQIEEEELC